MVESGRSGIFWRDDVCLVGMYLESQILPNFWYGNGDCELSVATCGGCGRCMQIMQPITLPNQRL